MLLQEAHICALNAICFETWCERKGWSVFINDAKKKKKTNKKMSRLHLGTAIVIRNAFLVQHGFQVDHIVMQAHRIHKVCLTRQNPLWEAGSEKVVLYNAYLDASEKEDRRIAQVKLVARHLKNQAKDGSEWQIVMGDFNGTLHGRETA